MTSLPSEPDLAASLRDTLRLKTRDVHLQLEDRLNVEHGAWTIERYASFLRGTLSIVGHTEPLLASYLPSTVADAELSGMATTRLMHDLATLASTVGGRTTLDPGASPATPLLPAIADAATAFGAAYVLEGSRLGGPVIAGHLTQRLGLRQEQMTYLSSGGASIGTRWRGFCQELDAYGAGADERSWHTVVDAATLTFSSLERALDAAGALDAE